MTSRSRPVGYGVAVAAVGLAFLAKLLLDPLIPNESPFLLFFAAVMVGAIAGGLGPGVLATLLAAIVSDYFFLEPVGSFRVQDAGQWLRLGIFVAEGLAISALSATLRSALGRTEEALEGLSQAEEKYRSIFENTVEGIFQSSVDGRLITVNPALARMYGYESPEEMISASSSEGIGRFYVDPGRRADLGREMGEHGSVVDFEIEANSRNGRRIWISVNARALRDATGNVTGFEGTVEDITKRKRAEQALRESEERYRVVAETASDAIVMIDEDSRILFVNDAAEKIFGYADEEMLGERLTLLMPEHLRQAHLDSFRRYLDTGRRRLNWEAIQLPGLHKSGGEVPLEVSFGESSGEGKRYFIGFIRDITERKRAENSLREAREDEQFRMARDLHDTVLHDVVYAVQEINLRQVLSTEQDPGLDEVADILRNAVEALRTAVFELRLEGDSQRPFVESLESLVDLNRRMARKKFEIGLSVEGGFPRSLPGRTGLELTRIVQEALANARRHSGARLVQVNLGVEGDHLWAEVADDGRGFDPDASRAGLGVSSMLRRASRLGGELEVHSRPGAGARLRLRVPAAQLVAEEPAPRTTPAAD